MNEKAKETIIEKFISDNTNKTDNGNVIIIREGSAPKQLDAIKPNKVHLKGVISAPSEFYNKRKHLHNPDKCHVIFDKNIGSISLVVDEQFDNDNYKVTGTITDNPDLNVFKINQEHLFGIKELMQIIKFNRIHFIDKEQNAKIVLSLQNFKGKIEKVLTDKSDLRGQDEKSVLTKLEHELEESFKLQMPIHKGGKPYVFNVDICVSASSADVQVWLESKELKELQDYSKSNMIDEELKNFSEIVCIEI
jgi:hypothetical protein